MAHPKRKTKEPRWRELTTVLAGRSRRRLITLSRRGVGRKAVHEFTGLDHKTLREIKSGATKYVRRSTHALIFSVPFNAHCDKALIPARKTWQMVTALKEEGFTQSELARRLGNKPSRRSHQTLNIGKDRVTAKTQMKVEQLYNRVMAEAVA